MPFATLRVCSTPGCHTLTRRALLLSVVALAVYRPKPALSSTFARDLDAFTQSLQQAVSALQRFDRVIHQVNGALRADLAAMARLPVGR